MQKPRRRRQADLFELLLGLQPEIMGFTRQMKPDFRHHAAAPRRLVFARMKLSGSVFKSSSSQGSDGRIVEFAHAADFEPFVIGHRLNRKAASK